MPVSEVYLAQDVSTGTNLSASSSSHDVAYIREDPAGRRESLRPITIKVKTAYPGMAQKMAAALHCLRMEQKSGKISAQAWMRTTFPKIPKHTRMISKPRSMVTLAQATLSRMAEINSTASIFKDISSSMKVRLLSVDTM